MVSKGLKWDARRDKLELEIILYTVIYLNYIINKNLLHSTGNSTQYSVIKNMGKEAKREQIYKLLSPFTVCLTLTQHCKAVMQVCSAAQSCPPVCNPLDCSPLDASVHRILQERLPAWATISSSRRSSQPRNLTRTGKQILHHWATWEAPSQLYSNVNFKF